MSQQIIKCYKCKGKGKLVSDEKVACGILTFGLLLPLALILKDDCDACNGKGYIKL